MHTKNWIHLNVKPDNVFLNWHVDKDEVFHLGKVVLGDMDCALKLKGERLLSHRIGNVMWRSPEGQLGRRVGKHSEIFSFGLVCFYVMTGVEWLHTDFEQLKQEGTEPEMVVLYNLLAAFGPLPQELVKHVDDEEAELLEMYMQYVS
ncbi:hypothetical protein CFE70_005269 [Pyrenophora teres f. teres 0-1]|uniref:Calcium calmodulin dependent protein kinase n=1 Tax=Pyrenophora teres f. teres TaxID=97479 RepID=A0A6S6W2J5_9PLEO|nr:hypothetical protein HRS9122_09591 [Pyrenophora teres f. teres]KAE8839214.1 hypothetical protein HRS9139_03597 [Pyrenophora teres f. teres]KAE8845178.1 hypothetical protein PTNB85_03443 [Pyrenophora teres f. teres]KAE8865675.1 hypothetical protein PTNB29_02822 [Pyrenophora teres f. teres]KAE8871309.1 hypothetical protein PTNB73_02768 [Pyrenophora teres f. teres]